MCGINGILDLTRIKSNESMIERVSHMNELLTHRGPDDEGLEWYAEANMGFGHRRLSIQDLSSAGHQPMLSHTGRFAIVYNGEIYNFKRLRISLQKSGVVFNSGSDTEVILALLEKHDLPKVLQMLEGMFAMAIYDRRQNELIFARDRMGEKPLYYHFNEKELLFSSELKPVLSASEKKFSIREESLNDYFRFGYVPGSATILEGVFKLLPGHFLRLPCNASFGVLREIAADCYLVDEEDSQNVGIGYEAAVSTLDELIQKSVSQQSISDVSLGSFLSGGIDSSLVTAVAQSQSQVPIETFTIGFKDRAFDESPYARDISNHIGAKSNVLKIGEDELLDQVFDALDSYDEPFANSSSVAAFLLTKYAQQKVTVCLSGDGGDELFMGYNRYLPAENLYNKISAWPRQGQRVLSVGLNAASKINIDYLVQRGFDVFGKKAAVNYSAKLKKLSAFASIKDKAELYRFLSSYHLEIPLNDAVLDKDISRPLFSDEEFEENFVHAAMRWDQTHYLPGDCLYKSDRAAMASSIEVRVPLLDPSIIDFSRSLPVSILGQNGVSKSLLKSVLEKYIPKELFNRPKMGFTVPVDRWINTELASEIDSLLVSPELKDQGLLSTSKVQSMLKQHRSGQSLSGNSIWSVFCFQRWLKSNADYLNL